MNRCNRGLFPSISSTTRSNLSPVTSRSILTFCSTAITSCENCVNCVLSKYSPPVTNLMVLFLLSDISLSGSLTTMVIIGDETSSFSTMLIGLESLLGVTTISAGSLMSSIITVTITLLVCCPIIASTLRSYLALVSKLRVELTVISPVVRLISKGRDG